MDKAYIDYQWLSELQLKGEFSVTRAMDHRDRLVIGQHAPVNGKAVLGPDRPPLWPPELKSTPTAALVTYYDEITERT